MSSPGTAAERRAHDSGEHAGRRPGDLADALAGDRAAWGRIVEDHTKLLWWIARSYRMDDSSAADLVQTVWLQLIRFGDRIADPARLPAWLATTARREAQRRTARREVSADWIEDRADRLAPAADERLIDEETVGTVLAAFARLPAEDQRLLRLLCEDPPRTYQEIVAILGKSNGYIEPTRQRAIFRLRALVKEME